MGSNEAAIVQRKRSPRSPNRTVQHITRRVKKEKQKECHYEFQTKVGDAEKISKFYMHLRHEWTRNGERDKRRSTVMQDMGVCENGDRPVKLKPR